MSQSRFEVGGRFRVSGIDGRELHPMALLARDDREVRASRIDLMFYRNFFIYVGSEYKNPVLETLEAPLREGGYLSCWARPKRCPPT